MRLEGGDPRTATNNKHPLNHTHTHNRYHPRFPHLHKQASHADQSALAFVAEATGRPEADAAAALAAVGFDDALAARPIGGLSGGWKMKLALTRCDV